jgi:hypothetical protein
MSEMINNSMSRKPFKIFLNEKLVRSTEKNIHRILPSFQHTTGDIHTKNQLPDKITGTHYIGRDVSKIAKPRLRRKRLP